MVFVGAYPMTSLLLGSLQDICLQGYVREVDRLSDEPSFSWMRSSAWHTLLG